MRIDDFVFAQNARSRWHAGHLGGHGRAFGRARADVVGFIIGVDVAFIVSFGLDIDFFGLDFEFFDFIGFVGVGSQRRHGRKRWLGIGRFVERVDFFSRADARKFADGGHRTHVGHRNRCDRRCRGDGRNAAHRILIDIVDGIERARKCGRIVVFVVAFIFILISIAIVDRCGECASVEV